MQFFYENQNTNSFLVYRLEESDKLDSFNYGMLANNKINNIIPANLTQVNADKYLKYNVSSTVTLKQYFEGIVNKNRIVNVFLSICNALMDANEYMIDTSMIILDPEYIFVDVSTAKASLICFPIVGYSREAKTIDFFKNIIFTTQYDRTENSDYVAEIITFLNSSENFSIEKFKNMISKLTMTSTGSNPVTKAVEPVTKAVQNEPKKGNITDTPKSVIAIESDVSPKSTPAPVSSPANQVARHDNSGFAIPGKNVPLQDVNDKKQGKSKKDKKAKTNNKEEKMSLMYLLSNFSKENLEIYKAQKEQNAGVSADVPQPVKQDREKKLKKKNKGPVGNPVAGFAIPGQAAPVPTPIPNTQSQTSQQSDTSTSRPVNNGGVVNNSSPVQNRPVASEVSGNFGQTTNLSAMSEGTTVLGSAAQSVKNGVPISNPRLIRSKNNETIKINKPVFRIGKENSYVDYFIADNSAISRSHANVVCKDDGYFIVDTNSTNHTYVNGVMVQSNIEMQINDRDIIRLADEDFEFRVF